MKRIKEYYVTIIVIAAVIVINIVAFCLYISNINKNIESQTEAHLTEIMEEASTCVELKMDETIHELEMTAFYIGMSENYEEEGILNNISRMTKKAGFEKFDIVDAQGHGMESAGNKDYSDTKLFQKVMGGNLYIIDYKDENNVTAGVRFAVPVTDEEGLVKGAYVVECNLDDFTSFLDLDSVSTKGKAFIIKSDGTVLSRKSGSSIRDVNDILNDDDNVKTLKNYMKSKKSGVIGFLTEKNAKRYICYSKTDFNSWEIIIVISSASVEANVGDVTRNFVFLGIVIAVMLIVLIGYFIYTLVNAQSQSAINQKRYYMVSRYTDDIIFDYSCVKDTLYCNENWKKIFGYDLPKENAGQAIGDVIWKDDMEVYRNSLEQVKKTEELVQFKCRILDSSQNAVSCICKIFGVKDNMRKLIKIVGVIEKSV